MKWINHMFSLLENIYMIGHFGESVFNNMPKAPNCRSSLISWVKVRQITNRQPRIFHLCRLATLRTSGVGRWNGHKSLAYLDFGLRQLRFCLSDWLISLTWSHLISFPITQRKRQIFSLVTFHPQCGKCYSSCLHLLCSLLYFSWNSSTYCWRPGRIPHILEGSSWEVAS